MNYNIFFILGLFVLFSSCNKEANSVYFDKEFDLGNTDFFDISGYDNLQDFVEEVVYLPLERVNGVDFSHILEVRFCEANFYVLGTNADANSKAIIKYTSDGHYVGHLKENESRPFQSFDVQCDSELLLVIYNEPDYIVEYIDIETGNVISNCLLENPLATIFHTRDNNTFTYYPYNTIADSEYSMQLIDSDCTSSNTGFGDAVSPLNVSNISGAATRSGNEFALNPIGTNTLTYYNSSGQKLANLNFLNLPELSNDYTHFQGVNFPIVGTYINDSYYYGSFYSPEYYFHILVNRSTGEMHKIPALMKLSNYGKKFDFLFSNIVASYGNNFVSSVTYDKYNSVINSNSIISNHMEHIPVMQEGDFPMLVYYDFAF